MFMLPFVTLLAWAAALWVGAWILRRLAGGQRFSREFLAWALVAGLATGALSAVARAERHAGTGIYTTWGWPRPVYTRWVSWELPAGTADSRHGGLRLRGLVENAIFYGGLAALIGATVGATRRRSGV
jgi:hypothetical protein